MKYMVRKISDQWQVTPAVTTTLEINHVLRLQDGFQVIVDASFSYRGSTEAYAVAQALLVGADLINTFEQNDEKIKHHLEEILKLLKVDSKKHTSRRYEEGIIESLLQMVDLSMRTEALLKGEKNVPAPEVEI